MNGNVGTIDLKTRRKLYIYKYESETSRMKNKATTVYDSALKTYCAKKSN